LLFSRREGIVDDRRQAGPFSVTAVLVTGGTGFVGSHLAAELLARGYEVDVADDLSTGSAENLPDGARLVEVELSKADALTALPRSDYAAILHLAGQSSGEKSFDDPVRDLDANVRSTLLLTQFALEHAVPTFLYASSMGVYGNVDSYPAGEDTPTRPCSYYGASKLAAERILAVAAAQGLRTCALRMFSVYGPGQNLADLRQGMASIYLSYLLRGEPVQVRGSLDRVRDFVHVDDVVAAWMLALEQPSADGAFNLGTGRGTTVRELLALLIETCGLPPDHPISVEEDTPGDQFALSADISRIRAELGWQPTIALEEGLPTLVAWARSVG
jgi:UDP-glucose 4-epimerase